MTKSKASALGVLIGGPVGAALAFIFGVTALSRVLPYQSQMLMFLIGGVIVGALVGAIAGTLLASGK